MSKKKITKKLSPLQKAQRTWLVVRWQLSNINANYKAVNKSLGMVPIDIKKILAMLWEENNKIAQLKGLSINKKGLPEWLK